MTMGRETLSLASFFCEKSNKNLAAIVKKRIFAPTTAEKCIEHT